MSISEQVKELRAYANVSLYAREYKARELLRQAADTIESLYAKLKSENCEAGDMISRKKLIKELFCKMPYQFGTQAMDWFRELIDGQPKASVADCGGGWIYCGDGKNLPKAGKRYQVTAIWKDGDFETRSVYDGVYGSDGQWHGKNYIPVPYEVVAWRLFPEPYKADMEGHRENTANAGKSLIGVKNEKTISDIA